MRKRHSIRALSGGTRQRWRKGGNYILQERFRPTSPGERGRREVGNHCAGRESLGEGGAAVVQWSDYLPPTKANRVLLLTGSLPNFLWESCKTMPLVGGFSLDSPAPPPSHFVLPCRSILTRPHQLSIASSPPPSFLLICLVPERMRFTITGVIPVKEFVLTLVLDNHLASQCQEKSICYFSFKHGATVSERLECSPPTMANRVQSPAGSPDFRKWESCRTMPLVSGFSRGSPVISRPFIPASLHLHFNHPHRLSRPLTGTSALKFPTPAGGRARALVRYHNRPMRYPSGLHHDRVTAAVNISVLYDCFIHLSSHLAVETMLKRCTRRVAHVVRREHCTPVQNLAFSGVGALDERGSVALIASVLLSLKRRKKKLQVSSSLNFKACFVDAYGAPQPPGNFVDSSEEKENCIHVDMCLSFHWTMVCKTRPERLSTNDEPARKIRNESLETWSGVKSETCETAIGICTEIIGCTARQFSALRIGVMGH
ncbi:hypothetical protein PR048_016180 [Dryococelus australis]|uniref:Uncharacterized protein n=1 Tax=Dryococelus australis TaxID=614101 RepID=A0ABQ9HJ08_9NEOP|nr:hypothetical protein PR048_016180 [Dryococelus australis]